jgi:uncharacterized RmlC-like cupin family protein
VIKQGRQILGKQGVEYLQGVSAELVGSHGIHLQILTIPPGGMERAHKHSGHETALYVVSGASGVWWGDDLQHHEQNVAGDFTYIAADVPHMPYNSSDIEPCVVIIARTDPNEQESVTLLPELEARWKARHEASGV